jgi:SAM-dependent methyltransferase
MTSPTLVDFGCGNMPYRAVLAPYVARYMGIDLPGNAQADFVLRENGTTSTPDGFAEIVLSTQVLEHVGDPDAYLREAHRMLKPGGLLMLSTHGLWLYHADPTDYWRWTGPGLAKLIESAGFSVVQLEGVLGLLPAGLQLAHDGFVRGVLPKKLRRIVGPVASLLMQTPMMWLDNLHTDEQRRKDAAAFFLVARR